MVALQEDARGCFKHAAAVLYTVAFQGDNAVMCSKHAAAVQYIVVREEGMMCSSIPQLYVFAHEDVVMDFNDA